MTLADIIQSLPLITAAFVAAIGLVLGFAGGIHLAPRIQKIASAWLITILLIALGASTLASGRNTALYGVAESLITGEASGYSAWFLRLATALTVGISLVIVASSLVNKSLPKNAALPLFLAYTAYFFSTFVVSGIFGTERSISHKTFYPFLVIFALYATSDFDETQLIRLIRNTLLGFLALSLALIPIKPELVMQPGYQGLIPGLTSRFWGLASHANNIGPTALFLLLVLCWTPFKSRMATMLAVTLAVTTIALSQSKTTFISALIVGMLFICKGWFYAIFSNNKKTVISIPIVITTMALIVVFLITFIADIYSTPLEKLLAAIQGRGTLLTGRENIWSITIAQWENNPLFGYGPKLWGEEFAARYGYTGIASNSHNQFIDVLGTGGIFGATALLVYAITLIRYAFLLAGTSKWVSISFILFLGIRCVSEVPLKTTNITTSDFIMHATILGIFMRAATRLERNDLSNSSRSPTKI